MGNNEWETLEKISACDMIDSTDDMYAINYTWEFKLKIFPVRLINKPKDRFCARGDQQLSCVDFFKTYAPVVQWTTICLMLILEVIS